MNPLRVLEHPALRLDASVQTAIARTLDASASPDFKHLPLPVRFRASGALRAWQQVLDAHTGLSGTRDRLSSSATSIEQARQALADLLTSRVSIRPGAKAAVVPLLNSIVRVASDMLTFWLRDGALYEPTVPLGTLLGGSDMSSDLPLELVKPPCAALCIVPPWQQRHHCANANSIFVFETAPPVETVAASRVLTFVAYRGIDGGVEADQLTLPVSNESDSLVEAVNKATAATRPVAIESGFDGVHQVNESVERWIQVLDYAVKVLLFLRLDNAPIQEQWSYTAAPRQFPGLGRRKREAKLAEVDKLYDRYIVGPQSLHDLDPSEGGVRGVKRHELAAHWRRGHFRLQAHGPQATMRKIMFIAPTVVRADKLSAA